MGIEIDISDVLKEVGVSFTIERVGIPISDIIEYLTYVPNSQVTKPFVREFFLECVFVADTQVVIGDIITFVITNNSYLVMNLTPDLFENEVIRNLAVLYKTNALIDIYHPQFSTVGYDTTFNFQLLYSEQKALIAESLFGNIDAFDEHLGSYNLKKSQLYLPQGYNLEEQDRIIVHNTLETYQVETVIKRRFPNVIVADLGEDTRE